MSVLCTEINKDFSYDNRFLEKLNMTEKSEIMFSYISDFRSAKIIREFMSDLSIRLWVSKKWETRLVLITDELNNNAIEYWSKSWESNKLKVTFVKKSWIVDLSVEVEDTWNWLSPKNAMEMKRLKKEKKKAWFDKHNSIRWRWLFLIIDRLVDKMYFKDSKNWWLIVWINIRLQIKKD